MTAPGEWMAAEMASQPEVIARLAARRGDVVGAVRALLPHAPAGTVIVARGSSDYAAVFGRYAAEAATGRPAALAAPSLTTVYDVDLDLDGWLAVGVSQSGRTPEVASVLRAYREAGASAVAVTNEPESPLAEAAELVIELGAGTERAVPATKTLTAQVAAMAMIAEALGPVPWGERDWRELPGVVADVLDDSDRPEQAAEAVADAGEMACVARGYLNCVALEAALKLREAAGVRAEGWSAADFRHGPETIAGDTLPLLAISAAGPAAADVAELAARWRRGGNRVLRVADDAGADLPFAAALAEPLAAVPAIVRTQQLALALGRRRGVDPDRPPRLAKVTPTR
jgi:glucosamine--fructose-6-phosphate aminotransferase (isomerizing)